MSSSCILDTIPLSDEMLVKYFYIVQAIVLCPNAVPFAMQNLLSCMRSHLLVVDLSASANSILFRKSFPVPMCSRLFPTFSSIRFSVSIFMKRIFIDLRLNFLQGHKYGSLGVCLHVVIQF